MQTVIVYTIVFLCAIYAGRHLISFFYKKNKSEVNNCGCGCSGCHLAQKGRSCSDKIKKN